MGFAPIASLKICISGVTGPSAPPPLFYAPFSKFKIDHFEVPIPPAENYQTFCARDVIQISASSPTITEHNTLVTYKPINVMQR